MEKRAKSEKWKDNEDWLAFWTTIGLDDPFHDVRTIQNLLLHKETEAVSATEPAAALDYEAKRKKLFGEEKRISSWLALSTILGLDDPFRHVSRGLQNFLLQKKTEEASETAPAESPDYEKERKKFLEEEKGISSWKVAFKLFRVPLIASFIFLVAVSWWIFSRGFQEGTREERHESQETATTDQRNQSVGMTRVEAALVKGVVEVPLDLVKKHKLVSFEYKGVDGPIPLLAYATPSGKIMTAVGISEPCNSRSFHLEGNEIVCNLCFTRWDLETLKGVSGDCADHSMDILIHVVNNERIMVKEADIQNWKPPVLRG